MILAIFDHLWQSTLFTLVVGLLTLAMRTNRANARFCLWSVASLKFLVPFSLFIGVGKQLGWLTGVATSSQWTIIISDIARPSSIFSLSSATQSNTTTFSYGLYVVMALWSIGFVAVVTRWVVQWKRIKAAVRIATPVNWGLPIDTRYSTTVLEPGVVGIRNPVLLLPKDIETHLTPTQLRAVLDHEVCHVRRRDNLTSALHMVVEALFWFYPPIWWLGTRLIEERERACDEAVVRCGNDPHDYAEGILRVCKSYLGSPLVCTSGVSGGDLTKRIENIMSNRILTNLGVAKRLLLGSTCSAALLGPVVVGLLDAPPARAQSEPIALQFAADSAPVSFAESGFRIYANNIQQSGSVVRCAGNVTLKIADPHGPVRVSAQKTSDLGGDAVAEGDLRIDDTPSGDAPVSDQTHKSMLLEGHVQIEVDGRIFTTERAIMSRANLSAPSFKMDTLEVITKSSSDPIPNR